MVFLQRFQRRTMLGSPNIKTTNFFLRKHTGYVIAMGYDITFFHCKESCLLLKGC